MVRLNPRRTIPARLFLWAPTSDGSPAWADPIDVVGVYDDAVQTTSDLTPAGAFLLPRQDALPTATTTPAPGQDATFPGEFYPGEAYPGALFNEDALHVHSRLDVAGRALTVTGARAIWSRRRIAYIEAALADPLPTHLGWRCTVDAMDGGGMDDNNDPLPPTPHHVDGAVIVLGGSLEPEDRTIDAVTSAQLYLPAGESIGSTASVTITGCPVEKDWQVVGDPEITPTRTVVRLQRGA